MNRTRTVLSFFLLPFLFSFFFFACADDEAGQNRDADSGITKERKEDSAATIFDAYGERYKPDGQAGRIISLAPNMTEIVAFLGTADRLVGRTDFCNYPPEILSVPSIGTLNSYNYERIVRLKPDLTLMSTFDGSSRKEYDKLAALGAHPFALAGQSITGTLNMIDTVGMLLGVLPEAHRRTDSLRTIVDSVRTLAAAARPVRTFIVLNKAPLITVSRGFIDEMLRAAGGENIAAGDPIAYPEFSRELLVRLNPEVILVPADSRTIIDELLETYPEWREIDAVKNGRLYTIHQDLVARPGPRIAEGIREMFGLLHGRGA